MQSPNEKNSYDKTAKKNYNRSVITELNELLMESMTSHPPGFAPPCRKPHLSLYYGVNAAEKQKEMQEYVRNHEEYKKIFEKVYVVDSIELWKTGGGLKGIPNWEMLDRIQI